MRSLILDKIAQGILPVAALFAIYLLLRGHQRPGGGFAAGLVVALAVALAGISFGAGFTRRRLAPLVRPAVTLGLLLAVLASCLALAAGAPFFTHYHLAAGPLSTTLLFDVGVFLVVVGTATTFMAALLGDDR